MKFMSSLSYGWPRNAKIEKKKTGDQKIHFNPWIDPKNGLNLHGYYWGFREGEYSTLANPS